MNWIIAVTLLTAPADTPEPVPIAEEFAELRVPLLALCVEWEILDPREAKYTFFDLAEFQHDLDVLRARRLELLDAPRILECWRYPERWYAEAQIAENRLCRRWVEAVADNYPEQRENCVWYIRRLDAAYRCWDLIRDAKADYYYTVPRRRALAQLREMEK